MRRTQEWKQVQFRKALWRDSNNTLDYPSGAILHFDASLGFVDQTGNQTVTLIGDAYPTVTAGFAINATGKEWGFDTSTGPVKAVLESGEVTLVQVVTLPLMSTLTDETDYSLFGDLLFVRRDGTSGSFKVSDGTNVATCAASWEDGDVVTVVCFAANGQMKVSVVSNLVKILERVKNGRVDFAFIGDSNALLGGTGWDHGFQYALSQSFPMYATGLISQGENLGSGAGVGYFYNRVLSAGIFAYDGAPDNLNRYLSDGNGQLGPHDYVYLESGETTTTVASGMIVDSACPIDTTAQLEFDVWAGKFDESGGTFKPSARLEYSPYTLQATSSAVSTQGVSGSIERATVTIPPLAGRGNLGLKLNQYGSTKIVAPFFSTYMRVRNESRKTGFSWSCLHGVGGHSARDMAYSLQQATDETLTHFFSVLRADQGDKKTICIVVNSGLNDRNATLPSVGPAAVADADSAEAFVDNMSAIVARIKSIWALNGWDEKELFWLLMVSHPVATPDDAELVSYRSALETYGATLSQCQVLDFLDIATQEEFVSEGWYASSGSDTNHLVQAAYETLGSRLVSAFAVKGDGSRFVDGQPTALTAPLPLSGQLFKSHALPIAAKKLTVFPGVASQAQINEAQ